jgi:hypothetical protein
MRIGLSLAMAVSALAMSAPPSAQAQNLTIQPGSLLRTPSGTCTAGFVFHHYYPHEGWDWLYLSTAGHCTKYGDAIYDEQWNLIGVTAFSADEYPLLDFALIEIRPDRIDDLSPQMRSSGAHLPTAGPPENMVRTYGHGANFRDREETRARSGVLLQTSGATFDAALPCAAGDSGAAVVRGNGDPLGIVNVAKASLGAASQTVAQLGGNTSPVCAGNTITQVLTELRRRYPYMYAYMNLVSPTP